MSPLLCLVATHSLALAPGLFPSLSPFLSLVPSLSPGLCPDSVPSPGLGSARGFCGGCRDERTTWSFSAGTCVPDRYREPNSPDTKTGTALANCVSLCSYFHHTTSSCTPSQHQIKDKQVEISDGNIQRVYTDSCIHVSSFPINTITNSSHILKCFV